MYLFLNHAFAFINKNYHYGSGPGPSATSVSSWLYIPLLCPSSSLTSQPLLLYMFLDLLSMPSQSRRERSWPRLGAMTPLPAASQKWKLKCLQSPSAARILLRYYVASGPSDDSNIGRTDKAVHRGDDKIHVRPEFSHLLVMQAKITELLK
jgi:hypothetical protein